jgi:hypothetical protein
MSNLSDVLTEKLYTFRVTKKSLFTRVVSGELLFEGEKLRYIDRMLESDVESMLAVINGAWVCGYGSGYCAGQFDKEDKNESI